MDKIQIMTQPGKSVPDNLREATVEKLHRLVAEAENNKDSNDGSSTSANEDSHNSSPHSSASTSPTPSRSPSPVDFDAEVHSDKIPLDGAFSTEEMKELVDMAKEEGLLKSDIDVRVVEHNDLIGDRVEVVEEVENQGNLD